MKSSEADEWKEAIKAKLKALEENETWEMITNKNIDKITSIIDTKWVFRKKKNEDKKLLYKARLVARSFKQKGIGEHEIHSTVQPVARVPNFFLKLKKNFCSKEFLYKKIRVFVLFTFHFL